MLVRIFILLILLQWVTVLVSGHVLVRVKQGWLSGEILRTVTGNRYYASFKGIPYAQPPLGNLRFKAPHPPLPWIGIRNAKEHGSICQQFNYSNKTAIGSEDCLFLNVYTPKLRPHKHLPVMVFIHGGAYISGSGNVDTYGPDFLVEKDVIVVTMNYRLDALGFLCIDIAEAPGNAGLKDQHAALVWVQKNIAAFGGDPRKVTLFGQSAGSASVAFHVLSLKSKGLFRRAITMSGAPYCDFSVPYHPKQRAFQLGKLLGFETKNSHELLMFLQSVESSRLVGDLPDVLAFEDITNNILKRYPFVPVVEKKFDSTNFLVENSRTIFSKGSPNKVDLMFGYTNEEILIGLSNIENDLIDRYSRYHEMFVPTAILYHSSETDILEISDKICDFYFGDKIISIDSMREFISYLNNATFVYNIQRFYSKFPKRNNKVYFYKFSSVSNRNIFGNKGAKYGISGAAHMDDLMYLFDAKALNMTIDKSSTEYLLIEQMVTLMTNFAKFGNPTPDSSLGITWPEFDNETWNYMNIGNSLTVSRAPDREGVDFWKTILQSAGIEW